MAVGGGKTEGKGRAARPEPPCRTRTAQHTAGDEGAAAWELPHITRYLHRFPPVFSLEGSILQWQ